MHEYSLAENIFTTVMNTAKQHNVTNIIEIRLELGDFSLVVEDFLERSFKILSKGSILENTKLVMKRTPGILKCNDCGKISEIWFKQEKEREDLEEEERKALGQYEEGVSNLSSVSGLRYLGINLFSCRYCNSRNTNLTGGKELKIKNIQVSDDE